MNDASLPVLVERRKACRVCMTRNPGEIHNGSEFDFDPAVVSYWSQWLGNPRPRLLIVGQDFGNVGYFQRFSGVDEPRNATNDNLRRLLAEAGFTVGIAPTADVDAPIFLTNSILCLKSGSMSGPIKDPWVRACATLHLVPLLKYLRPPVVVGMGKGWLAVRTALGLKDAPNLMSQAAGRSWKTKDHFVFAVGHCSGLGLVNRSMQQQVLDWRAIGFTLSAMKEG